MIIEDRTGHSFQELEQAANAVADAANRSGVVQNAFVSFNTKTPRIYADIDRTKAEVLGVPDASRLRHPADLSRFDVHQHVQLLEPHLPGLRAGRLALPQRRRGDRRAEDPLDLRRHGAAGRSGEPAADHRPLPGAALQPLPLGRDPGRHRAGLLQRPGPGCDGARRRPGAAERLRLRMDRPCPAGEERRLDRRPRLRAGGRLRLPGAGRPLRERHAAVLGHPDRADVHPGGDGRRRAQGPRQQHPHPGRPHRADRPRRQERHPDRRVRAPGRVRRRAWSATKRPPTRR